MYFSLLHTPVLILFLCLLGGLSNATAQADYSDHGTGPDYVQGPEYRVIDTPDGLRVFWRGKPLRRQQARRTGEYEFVVLDDSGKDRLVIRLNTDESLAEVIDLKYTALDEASRVRIGQISGRESAPERQAVEVVFENGLIFRYEEGQATAELPGVPVRLEGENGRYRLFGPGFEAGVSFDRTDRPVYKYFTPLAE